MIFGTMNHGRIFAHTLLFLLVLAVLAVCFKDIWLASLSAGVLAHLALDAMWNTPVILLRPLLGPFPPADALFQHPGLSEYAPPGLERSEHPAPGMLGNGISVILSKREWCHVVSTEDLTY
ncbi:MAG: hypothetical protein A4E44_00252 [Methanosaeta sp. PtaB.Bin018]|jgi:hypothetical protein|nr:MAG: hypothetical protein A4E44_00252 [Methanosaeta sp. PtaB.Bin018]OPY47187.1 MAG: hypothetical protein A4E46_00580 [Methanosaeta sp. PtaU1.Bin016]